MRIMCYRCGGTLELPQDPAPGTPVTCPHCGHQGTYEPAQAQRPAPHAATARAKRASPLGCLLALVGLSIVCALAVAQPWIGATLALLAFVATGLLVAGKLRPKSRHRRREAAGCAGIGAIVLVFSAVGFDATQSREAERVAAAERAREQQAEIRATAADREAALQAWLDAWKKAERVLVEEGNPVTVETVRDDYEGRAELERLCEPIPDECDDFEERNIAPIRARALPLARYARGADEAEERATRALEGDGTPQARWKAYASWRDAVRAPEDCPQAVCTQERARALRRADETTRELERAALSEWSYSESRDAVSGKTIERATVRSTNTVELGFPYQGPQRARLMLRSHPRHGHDVILAIERGQFLCRIRRCRVTVRFGDSEPQRFGAVEPADHSSTALFLRGYGRILRRLKKVDRLYIEARFYQQGNRVFEFNVIGLDWPR